MFSESAYQIIESYAMVQQWRFPRSKRRRITNKWASRAYNFKPRTDCLVQGYRIICHPVVAASLKAKVLAECAKLDAQPSTLNPQP